MNIKVNEIVLFYEKRGNGPVLLMLHGNGEDHKIFDEAAKVLEKCFTLYLIDTRGHGQSSTVTEFHYEDMAEDICCFIHELNIQKPILYGFSDGGIVGLLLAKKYPMLLSKIIISGVNTNPKGLKIQWQMLFRIQYFFNRSPFYKLMLTEPDISETMLKEIQIPVHMTVGSEDLISMKHTKMIQENIKESTLQIFDGEDHGSYIVKNKKIAEYILDKCL